MSVVWIDENGEEIEEQAQFDFKPAIIPWLFVSGAMWYYGIAFIAWALRGFRA